MKRFSNVLGVTCAAMIAFSGMAFSASHSAGVPKTVKARQALMTLNAYYLGILGGMAKGDTEYNAEAAVAAANSLKQLEAGGIDQGTMWAQGTSTTELGEATAAKPEIWSTWPAIMKNIEGIATAVNAMADAAGTLEGVQGAIGDVGKACGACHKEYRVKKDE